MIHAHIVVDMIDMSYIGWKDMHFFTFWGVRGVVHNPASLDPRHRPTTPLPFLGGREGTKTGSSGAALRQSCGDA